MIPKRLGRMLCPLLLLFLCACSAPAAQVSPATPSPTPAATLPASHAWPRERGMFSDLVTYVDPHIDVFFQLPNKWTRFKHDSLDSTSFQYLPDEENTTYLYWITEENVYGDPHDTAANLQCHNAFYAFVGDVFDDGGTLVSLTESATVEDIGPFVGLSRQFQVDAGAEEGQYVYLCTWLTPSRAHLLLLASMPEYWPEAQADVQTALASLETSDSVLAENFQIALFDSGKNRLMIDPLPAGWSIMHGSEMYLVYDTADALDGTIVYGAMSMETDSLSYLEDARQTQCAQTLQEYVDEYEEDGVRVKADESAPVRCTVGAQAYPGYRTGFDLTLANGDRRRFTLWQFWPSDRYTVKAFLITAPSTHEQALQAFEGILDSVALVPSVSP